MNKRQRPTKDQYFMAIAEVVKTRSPDPKTQVGAVLVDSKYRLVSTGFNGSPSDFDDESIDWLDRPSVYPICVHAEMNAILYASSRYENSILYVTLSPCSECIKLVAASGIKRVIFKDKYRDFDKVKVLADSFDIQLIQFEEKTNG